MAGVTIGTVAGAALLLVGALFMCGAFTKKKFGTPLNSKNSSNPEPSISAAGERPESQSISVQVEGETNTTAVQVVS